MNNVHLLNLGIYLAGHFMVLCCEDHVGLINLCYMLVVL